MTLLFIFLAMTFAVVMYLLFPLRRAETQQTARIDYDMAVYRDQLAEVEKDMARGLLGAQEAEGARTEIQRRMLAADSTLSVAHGTSSLRSKKILALAVMIVLPLGAALTYLYLGDPGVPAQPYAERKSDPEFILANEAERLAARLEAAPDVKGYKQLGAIYTALRFYDKAAGAYQKIIEMKQADAETWSGLGEAIALMNGGMVVPEARGSFAQALQMDRHEARARFYLGLAEEQIHEPRRAVAIWRDLEADGAPDASWRPMVREHIAKVAKESGFDADSVAPAPPVVASQDVAPAGEAAAIMAMSPDDQKAMIGQMVERLAAKMKDNPDDIDGWERLAKAYGVLGETEKARDAQKHADALRAKAPDGGK